MKYFDPMDIILSVFFYFKKFTMKGDMSDLQYTAVHLRELSALLIYHQEYSRPRRERINKRLIPVAEVKPTKPAKRCENEPPELVDLASEDDVPLINLKDSH